MVFVVILLTLSLIVATHLFFAWTNKYGDEWNWDKIKEGYTKGWPKLLIMTLLILTSTVMVWYVLPEPKSMFKAFTRVWNVWVPTWGIVGGFYILRSLYNIFRETRRVPKPWIAFSIFGLLMLIGSAVWYGFAIADIVA